MSVIPLKADIHQRGLHVRLPREGRELCDAFLAALDSQGAVKTAGCLVGPNASVADWSDIAADLLTEKDAEAFANSVGLERQAGDYGCHNYCVSVDGADLFARRYRYLVAPP
jgi:hypothetical protein